MVTNLDVTSNTQVITQTSINFNLILMLELFGIRVLVHASHRGVDSSKETVVWIKTLQNIVDQWLKEDKRETINYALCAGTYEDK